VSVETQGLKAKNQAVLFFGFFTGLFHKEKFEREKEGNEKKEEQRFCKIVEAEEEKD